MLELKLYRFLSVVLLLAASVGLAGCPDFGGTQAKGEATQEQVMTRAMERVQVPEINNFLTREMVAKWIQRQDTPDRPYYVYLFADTGQILGYYVAQSRPVSTCSFMTPPSRRVTSTNGNVVLPSPALDGVYYGAGSACDQWFFFDAATDAMIEVYGFKIFTSDAPLALDAEPILVQQQ